MTAAKPPPRRRRPGGPESASRPPLVTAEAQARGFRRSRQDRRNTVAEDYVEIIADLIDAYGEARVADIARRVGVTHVTVSNTIARLKRDGLVTRRPYRSIFLTAAGRRLALRSRRRHHIIVEFLKSLGIREPTARADAEGIEHHVSEETLSAFARATRSRR